VASRIPYRSVFISDIHLGCKGCRADELVAFLKRVDCENLYLVGDIIDMWRLKSRWHWPAAHNEVARTILKKAKKGANVVYIPGNHDEHARAFTGLAFGDVTIALHAVHETADGRTIFITHGDEADVVVKHARLLSMLGAWAYDVLLVVNTHYNRLRRLLGRDYWSLSKYLKLKVKSACTHIARFEDTLIREAKKRGYDGVVCGHIHQPEVRSEQGFTYYNCGDWVETGSALVELDDGTMRIIDAVALVEQMRDEKQADKRAARPGRRKPDKQIVHALADEDDAEWALDFPHHAAEHDPAAAGATA
jgi:UDP-2,3-diacylglucosamine pyrophosphatase LpxH